VCEFVSCVRVSRNRTTQKTLLHLAPLQWAFEPSKSKSNLVSVCTVIVFVLVKLTIFMNPYTHTRTQPYNHRAHIQTALRALLRIFYAFCLVVIAAQEMASPRPCLAALALLQVLNPK